MKDKGLSYMSSKYVKIAIGVIIGLFLAGGIFSAGLVTGVAFQGLREGAHALAPDIFRDPSTDFDPGFSGPGTDTDELFSPFWESWDIVHEQYVDQPIDDLALMRGALQGMLDALGDEHTSYMDPDQYQQATSRYEGTYEGIGVWVDATLEYLTIISTMPGSPAEAVGLQPGDEIIAVDGEDVTGIDGNLVIHRVLGPEGTTVELSIRREGELELLEFVIERARIIVPSVESEMLDDGIAYVRINIFGDSTSQDFHDTLAELNQNDPTGLILDLRGNPGGLLTASVEVASEFIDGGTILTERYGDGREDVHEAEEGGLASEISVVVLVDAGTASGSEIVAAAIQEYGRGLLVGETTFGKGSVQNWIELAGNNGAIRVTIARWFTPNDIQIGEVGLTPDVEVLFPDEFSETDIQLEKAIELLSAS
jgi:carboxyl-terminal processing protease